MDIAVFWRVRRPDDHRRIEKPCIPDRHAGFDAVPFGFNRGRDDTAVRGVVGRNNNRFAAKEGICLLLNRGKAGIEINVHDCRRVVIER